jgi:hypothetical protein
MLETLLTNGLLVAHLSRKYLIPFLVIGKRRKYAKWIAGIADEVTDDLRMRYPENEWLEHLDEAVDKVIEVCDISREIGRRVTQAAVSRKK